MNSRRKFTPEKLKSAVASSMSVAQVLEKLNLYIGGANYKNFKRYVKEDGLDTSHFTGQGHLRGKTHDWGKTQSLDSILIEDSHYTSSNHLRKRLIKDGVLKHQCYVCGITDWMGKPVSFELDHINGVNNDNRINNLRIVCPNCHSQTGTYCGKNKGTY